MKTNPLTTFHHSVTPKSREGGSPLIFARGRSVSVLIALAWFALAPAVPAVMPAPDGGYPGFNTAEGQNALFSLTTGVYNTALGGQALFHDRTGSRNTAVGLNALYYNIGGVDNTATGFEALFHNNSNYNTASGYQALFSNTIGNRNTANGINALRFNVASISNTAIGTNALYFNVANWNTAVGDSALFTNNASENTAIGFQALTNNITGFDNTAVGFQAGKGVTTASGVICIGDYGADVNNSCFIGNIRNVTTAFGDAIPVVIDTDSQLGTMSSSRRFKTDIKPMDKASESILALRPVSFHYKVHKNARPQFGLIAEEVAEVNPDLVARDKNGQIYIVRYDAVNAMLLNEFLKTHNKVQEQEATIASLNSTLARQDATITELKSTIGQQEKSFRSKLETQEKQITELTSNLQRIDARFELSKRGRQQTLDKTQVCATR